MFYSKAWEWVPLEKSTLLTHPKIKNLLSRRFLSVGETKNKSNNKQKSQWLLSTRISSKPKNSSFLMRKSFWLSSWNTVQTEILMIRSEEFSNLILKVSWNKSLMVLCTFTMSKKSSTEISSLRTFSWVMESSKSLI